MLSREKVFNDVKESTQIFKNKLNHQPEYYAIPFGSITPGLLIDINDSLRENKYKGALWVNHCTNIISNKYESQIIHLSRINTPTSLIRFLLNFFRSLTKTYTSIMNQITVKKSKARETYETIGSDNPYPAFSFENIVTQGKDYSSNEAFYKYSHTHNPYKKQKPDYYAVISSSGRMESINTPGKLTFLEALKVNPIIGSYQPSASAQVAWARIGNWRILHIDYYNNLINSKRKIINGLPLNYKISEFDTYPSDITPLANKANENYFFSIYRSPEFYKWRFDQYPLSRIKYYILYKDNKSDSYFVVCYNNNSTLISDFYCSSIETFSILHNYLIQFCQNLKLKSISIETTNKDVSNYLYKTFKVKPMNHLHYYYFNKDFPQIRDKWETIEKKWNQCDFHETQACSDLLLR